MAIAPNKRSIMTLYSRMDDSHSHRVRIVLAEKGVTFDTIDIDAVPNAQEELAEYNPYGSIPTLVDRDLTLYQSDVIMEYLDERFPHPPLMPVYPVARGRTRLMIYRINKDWYGLMEKIQLPNQEPSLKETFKNELRDCLTSVAPIVAEMPYFLSEEFSLIDCALAPLLWRLPQLGIELPPQAKAMQDYATRLFERESFKASLLQTERNNS
ncbi:MAG: sspA [Francisellaceae bacterium]|nr:sspA [Francisellaceae bacterium]